MKSAGLRQMANGGLRRVWTALGPGLVTGAADDDPSGIATYSPGRRAIRLRAHLDDVSHAAVHGGDPDHQRLHRLADAAGARAQPSRQLAARRCLLGLVALLVVANTINIAADLAAMGEALRLVIGGPRIVLCAGVRRASACVRKSSFRITAMRAILKFLTLVLLVYVAAAFSVHMPWGEVLRATFMPQISLDRDMIC